MYQRQWFLWSSPPKFMRIVCNLVRFYAVRASLRMNSFLLNIVLYVFKLLFAWESFSFEERLYMRQNRFQKLNLILIPYLWVIGCSANFSSLVLTCKTQQWKYLKNFWIHCSWRTDLNIRILADFNSEFLNMKHHSSFMWFISPGDFQIRLRTSQSYQWSIP